MFLIYFFIAFFQIKEAICASLQSDYKVKITGGEETEIISHPYMVNIITTERKNYLIDCHFGGTIINNRWILTAAHSAQNILNDYRPFMYSVVAGSTSCFDIEEDGQIIHIINIILHPEYKFDKNTISTNLENNIAVIQLEENLIFGPKIQPVILITPSISNYSIINDIQCEAIGWGIQEEDDIVSTPGLFTVKLPLISNDLCVELLKNFNISFNASIVYCTLDKEGKKGICFGDSDGPLMYANYQIGISSGDISCLSKYTPVIWTRVDIFYDWIQSAIQSTSHAKHKIINNNTSNLNVNILFILIMFLCSQ